MIIDQLKEKKVLLVGYGVDGKATERYLKNRIPGLKLSITDQRDGPNYLDKQAEFDIAIVSPGVPKRFITIPYESSTNIFFEEKKGMVIGITGTKGKSTTTKLIYEILMFDKRPAHLTGNIGKPLLETLGETNNETDIFVAELSSYQLEACRYSPSIAVVTSLFPDHIPNHGSLAHYYAAKANIVKHQKDTDHFVFPQDNGIVTVWPTRAIKHPVAGSYIALNMALARKVATILKVPENIIDSAVKLFHPLPHRLEYVGEFKGIKWYDDGAATVPEATIEGIKALKNVGTLLVGGQNRGYEFSRLAETIKRYGIKNIVFFPGTGEQIKAELEKIGTEFNALETRSMEEAVRFGYEKTPQGAICLLSTASTSYNLWKNFSEKGAEFQKWVRHLGSA